MTLYFRLLFSRIALYFLLFFAAISFSFFFMETLTRYLHTLRFSDLPLYYFAIVVRDNDVVISLAYLLALIATIQSLQETKEINTLQMAGLGPSSILLPFYLFALLLTIFSYALIEYAAPKAVPWIGKKGHEKRFMKTLSSFEVALLPDGSHLAFQRKEGLLKDVFWLQSTGQIWHCKEINPDKTSPVAFFVDVFEKKGSRLEKISSIEKVLLPLDFTKMVRAPDLGSESSLSLLLSQINYPLSYDRAKLESLISYKMIYPWFPHLFATLFLPGLFFFKRNRGIYLDYLAALFSFLLFFSVINTLTRLTENYIFSPFFVIIGIPLLLQSVFTFRMWKSLVCAR